MTDMELELGARVADAWCFENLIVGWVGRLDGYHGRPILRQLAEYDWRYWWHHV